MNLTIRLTSFLFLLLIFLGCKDDDLSVTDTGDLENYEAYQEDAFNIFDDSGFSLEDCELDDQNSIFMIGQIPSRPSLLKLDSNFDVEFSSEIVTDGHFLFRRMDMLKMADENFLYSSQIFNNSSYDIDVRKFDSSGIPVWNSKVGASAFNERAISAVEISDGGIVILAEDSDFSVALDSSFYLVTLNQNGELLSNLEIVDREIHEMKKILYSSTDNTVFTLGEYGPPGLGAFQSYLKINKYSLNGDLISSSLLLDEIDFFTNSSDMKILNDGNILVYTSSNTSSNRNDPTIQLIKLNIDLENIWTYEYDDIKINVVDDVQETVGGDLIILSKSSTISSNDEFDVILSKLNESFELEWIKSYGTTSSDQGRRLLIDANQDLIIVGNSNHNTDFQNNFSYFVLKTDPNGVPK